MKGTVPVQSQVCHCYCGIPAYPYTQSWYQPGIVRVTMVCIYWNKGKQPRIVTVMCVSRVNIGWFMTPLDVYVHYQIKRRYN